MAIGNKDSSGDRLTELLEKLSVMQMHEMGATQDQIAKTADRQKIVDQQTAGAEQ
jgi:hypothetical protein